MIAMGWNYSIGDVIRYDLSRTMSEDYEVGGIEQRKEKEIFLVIKRFLKYNCSYIYIGKVKLKERRKYAQHG